MGAKHGMGLATALVCGLALFFCGAAARADDADSDYLELGVGYSDILDDGDSATEFAVAYRPSLRLLDESFGAGDWWHGVGPLVGGRVNTDGGVLAHAGLFLDFRPLDRLVIWPSASVAAWEKGGSRDLGGTFEFMEEVFVGYRLPWNDLVGVAYQHVSNAHLHDDNPGHDILMATYTISFGPAF